MVHEITTSEEFKEVISGEPAIIMIYKDNCSFCHRAMPWLDEKLSQGVTRIYKANKDSIEKVLEVFQVEMYPTFIFTKEGKIEDIFYGDTVEEKVKGFIEKHLE